MTTLLFLVNLLNALFLYSIYSKYSLSWTSIAFYEAILEDNNALLKTSQEDTIVMLYVLKLQSLYHTVYKSVYI